MNRNVPLVLSILLFAGVLAPVYADTADHVVINEVIPIRPETILHLSLNGLNCITQLVLMLIWGDGVLHLPPFLKKQWIFHLAL